MTVTNSRIQVINNGRKYKMIIRDAMLTDAGDVVFTIKDLSCRTMLFVKGDVRRGGCLWNLFSNKICSLAAAIERKGFIVIVIFPSLEKPVHIFRDLLNVKAVPGEDAELSCEITKPDVTIRWMKNGHLIRQSPKYEMTVEKHLAKLVIRNTTIRDSGDYCCEAEGVASRAKLEIRGR